MSAVNEGAIMGNKTIKKVPINKERFMQVLKLNNSSIRKLGNAHEEIDRTEKTIRRHLDNGEMPFDLLHNIAEHLQIHPDYLSGVRDDEFLFPVEKYLKKNLPKNKQ